MLPLFHLRIIFYLVLPTEFSLESTGTDLLNLSQFTAPYCIAMILIEGFVYLFVFKKQGHAFFDCLASLCSQMLYIGFKSVVHVFEVQFYNWIYTNFGNSFLQSHYIAANIVAFLGVDFLHYWSHRWTHEVPVLWEFHKIHHSPEYHNLFSANRNTSAIEFLFAPFFSLLAFFVPTEQYILHKTLNDIYPWWLHTKVIPKLGPIETFAVTPSHHRVHHARNKQYIDKNYGNTLISWDKIFGTYQEELDSIEIEYGTTTIVKTYNIAWLEAQWVKALACVILRIPWKDENNFEEADKDTNTKGPRYTVKSSFKEKLIFLVQFAIVALAVKTMHTNKFIIGPLPSFLCTAVLLYHFGYLMDHNESLSKEGDILNRFGLMTVVLLACLWPAAIHFVVFLSVCAVHSLNEKSNWLQLSFVYLKKLIPGDE